jgi:hypothetical protein
MARNLMIPVSFGELVDKITILEIKAQTFQGAALEHVTHELNVLRVIHQDHQAVSVDPVSNEVVSNDALWERLRRVNRSLWQVEDALRDYEAKREFGRRFIALARSVYLINDRRAALKRQLTLNDGSGIVEEKSYGTLA